MLTFKQICISHICFFFSIRIQETLATYRKRKYTGLVFLLLFSVGRVSQSGQCHGVTLEKNTLLQCFPCFVTTQLRCHCSSNITLIQKYSELNKCWLMQGLFFTSFPAGESLIQAKSGAGGEQNRQRWLFSNEMNCTHILVQFWESSSDVASVELDGERGISQWLCSPLSEHVTYQLRHIFYLHVGLGHDLWNGTHVISVHF